MQDLWKRLESYLKKNAPAALDFLNPPATAKEIREAESELGVRFPADFAASLRIHNGQQQETGKPPHPILFIPQEYEKGGIYRATWGELAPLSFVVDRTKFARETVADYWRDYATYEYDGPVRHDGNLSWITFVDSGSGDILGLDLNPDKRGQVGQILSVIHDPSCFLVLAPSYRDWFETLVTRYETGRYLLVEEDGELDAVDRFRSKDIEADEPDDESEGILRFPV